MPKKSKAHRSRPRPATPRGRKRAAEPRAAAPRSATRALSVATNTRASVAQRVAALAELPSAVCEQDEQLQALLAILKDREEPSPVRLTALQSLQAASFSVVAFEPCRSDYIAALREVCQDPDLELRQRVLGILAREKDRPTQKRLLDGLRHAERALVPPEKALQLLAYDVHAEAYPMAREVLGTSRDPVARREALRLLAADATAAPLLERVLRDKGEHAEVRQVAASALNAAQPRALQATARDLLLDADESEAIQATCLTALTQFGNRDALHDDAALKERVQSLDSSGTGAVKASARQFMTKYGE